MDGRRTDTRTNGQTDDKNITLLALPNVGGGIINIQQCFLTQCGRAKDQRVHVRSSD